MEGQVDRIAYWCLVFLIFFQENTIYSSQMLYSFILCTHYYLQVRLNIANNNVANFNFTLSSIGNLAKSWVFSSSVQITVRYLQCCS